METEAPPVPQVPQDALALKKLKRRKRWATIGVLTIGMIAGIIFWGGLHTAIEASNSLAFCTTCHEMRDTVFKEYKESPHYTNRSGVRAICTDCHVPRDWGHMIVRKVSACKELWFKLIGAVDTKEKFEAKRMEMATHQWEVMKESDSRECRNCHSLEVMKMNKQKPKAAERHAKAQKDGKTCIDCHKGIAHLLPKEYIEPDED